jgi:branched-subunit amino acid ABC-type transport system permease component
MSLFWQQVAAGLILSGIFSLLALSMSLIYSVAEVVQFAQGDVMILGAYTGYVSARWVHSLPLALVSAVVVTAIIGLVLNEAVFRWIPRGSHLPLIAGLALSTVIEELLRISFNAGAAVTYPASVTSTSFQAGGAYQFVVFGIAVALSIVLTLTLRYTKYGRALRATADNSEMARLLGVRVQMMTRSAFAIGSGLAGCAGVLYVMVNGFITPYLGPGQEFVAIAAILLGGLGSAAGAVVGSVIVAMTQVMTAAYISSSWQPMFTFGLIILIVVVRPAGLFGRPTEVRA